MASRWEGWRSGSSRFSGAGDVSATVLAIARWNRTKSEGTFLDRLKSDEWEVVIPEIVVGGDP